MRNMILGTDWWTDCDDAVAIRLLSNFHRRKELNLLGVAINACMKDSVRSLDVFMKDCGVEVPISIDLEATDFGGNPPYQAHLAERPSRFTANEEAENPVAMYRRLLASSSQVEILEIGFPQVLGALLESAPDAYSPLSGIDLVRSKVTHLWVMAGKWDEPNGGKENNFARTRRASNGAARLCSDWPTPVTFLGFEVGESVISAGNVPENDLLHQVLVDHGSAKGRCSWDPMLILLAATGDPALAGYRCENGTASVKPEDGSNYFVPSETGKHRFVVKQQPDEWYVQQINDRLARIPE